MARVAYELARKVAAILADQHGLKASVSEDLTVDIGAFTERLSGHITREKIAELAIRIKGALN